MPNLVPIRRALLSVSDKTDLIPFARTLSTLGVQIISTGGTARALMDAGIAVTPIEQVTGFPEIMDGRVKTLHPAVHGALLGKRSSPEHLAAMKAHKIEPIDLVCINLYPFERTVSDAGVTMEEAIEQIDVGGPAMIRAAAKNFESVVVVTSPKRYDDVANELGRHQGCTTGELRAELAAAAFAKVAEYDTAIAAFLSRRTPAAFPQVLRLSYTKVDELRYGENPHQAAALYRDPSSIGPTIVNAQQLHGKPLSFNNINDAAAALEVVKSLRKLTDSSVESILAATFGATPSVTGAVAAREPFTLSGILGAGAIGACVVKHTNPCGAAVAPTVHQAVDAAIAGDPQAAYGGILAVNAEIDPSAADRIAGTDNFFEVIVAPSYHRDALEILRKRWANVRILAVGDRLASRARKLDFRSVPGGMLVQDRDVRGASPEQWEHRAGPVPPRTLAAVGAFLETVCKYVSSNAVVIGGTTSEHGVVRVFGIGSGQVDRVTACRNAIAKAGSLSKGAAAAGDAFFPFADGPQLLVDAGVHFIAHPGGSKRDQDTFDLCNARAVTCVTTGLRHFRH